jgi:ferredoxin
MEERQHVVTIKESGAQFFCWESETLLEAMKRARCGPVHYGCFGGGCGVCKMRVEAGEVEAIKTMSRAHISPQELAQGFVLLCCVSPRGSVTLSRGTVEG